MKNRSGVFAFLLVLILALALSFYFWLENVRKLDALCAEKNWFACAPAVHGDFTLSLPCEDCKISPAQYLSSYFAELAGTKNALLPLPNKPDNQLASFILKRAKSYQYQFNLNHLAEAYMRCAVGSYRNQCHQSLAELKHFSTNQARLKADAAKNLESLSLALRALSDLYASNNKFLIAERAAKESIDVVGQAIVLAGENPDVGERLHSQLLLARAAHIKLLRRQDQNEEADKETLLLQK